ncbi:unnamed protein product [marine sediment metagenome]|uniref:Uncharacterized protein n=1 Tax=marine sediment metagenome TaxID=412755 RepID=X1TEE1_9ZZZZ
MDAVFRSLNSNTQVSAGEINNLPLAQLPERATLSRVADLVHELIALGGIDASQSDRRRALMIEAEIDMIVNSVYGFSDEEESVINEVTVSLASMYDPYGEIEL